MEPTGPSRRSVAPSPSRASRPHVALWLVGVVLLGGASRMPDDPHAWPLACRLASYGKFQESAWAHLPTLGVRYLFLPVPEPDQVEAVKGRLGAAGLTALVVRGDADLGRADALDHLAQQLATCEALGVRYMFLSPKHTGIDREAAIAKLKQAGDLARKHNVTIALETHPDLGTNAATHLETMKAVDHPNVRVNFDTGNITYYNPGADPVAELEAIAPYVATVELKDHNRKPKAWFFPALGTGRIDFPGILGVLDAHGYDGPVTIEVEGVEGQTWDEAATRQAIAASVEYVRKLHAFR